MKYLVAISTILVRLRLERFSSLGKGTLISRKQIVNLATVLAMIFVPGFTAQKAQTSEVNKLPVEEPTNIQVLNSKPSDFVESYQRQKNSQQQSTSNLDEHSPFFKWNSLLKTQIKIGDKKEGFRVNYNEGNISSNPQESQNCSFEVVDKFFQPDHLVETLVVSIDNKIFEILPKDFNLATGYSENSAFEIERYLYPWRMGMRFSRFLIMDRCFQQV